MPSTTRSPLSRPDLERVLSVERLSTYVSQCGGRFDAAIGLYRWNASMTAAFWEPLGHLEIALRNTLSDRLRARHARLGRSGSWLEDPTGELTARARVDIARARSRVRRKGKHVNEGQTISELGFGFWRFLVTKRLTRIWPDLAGGFPEAPDRRRETVEEPLARLHEFRNRLAHHERIWNHDLAARHQDLLTLAAYVHPSLAAWVDGPRKIERALSAKPRAVRGPII